MDKTLHDVMYLNARNDGSVVHKGSWRACPSSHRAV